MPLLAILANPAREARAAMKPARSSLSESILRLARFSPRARREMSGAIPRNLLKVDVSGTKGEFVRFRVRDPKRYENFRMIVMAPMHLRGMTPTEARSRLGQTGFRRLTLGVIACPKGMVRGHRCTVGTELQAVLVPKVRVMAVAKKYLKRVAANPVSPILSAMAGGVATGVSLAVANRLLRNPGKSVRTYRVPPGYEAKVASALRGRFVWAMARDGEVLTLARPFIAKAVIRHVCGKQVGTVKKNPGKEFRVPVMDRYEYFATEAEANRRAESAGTYEVQRYIPRKGWVKIRYEPTGTNPTARRNAPGAQNVISIPFRQGRKYSVVQIARWLEHNGTKPMVERFRKALAQYKRFHKGAVPKFITYQTYKMGSHPGISDVEFGVSEGREWLAAYQVTRSSGKWADKASDGRYVHAHGDSDVEVDVKRPVRTSKLPHRFHTADGKSIGVIPSRNVKIGEWYEG